jgi:hypothetical protein
LPPGHGLDLGDGKVDRKTRSLINLAIPDQLRQSDQIVCGRGKGQRPIADEVNKLGRFDAEIHMRTSLSALAELMVRIRSPPAVSQQTFGSSHDDARYRLNREQADRWEAWY